MVRRPVVTPGHHRALGSALSLLLFLTAIHATPAALEAQASSVVLVRHAEKVDTTRDPALSTAGTVRAEALRAALAAYPLQGIFVSEYGRTAQTATPTADAFHLTPTVIPIQGSKSAQAAATAAAIHAMRPGSAALVIGHSNTVGMIIAALGGPQVPELCDMEYATLFVLELPADLPPRLLRASFGAPDSPEVMACHAAAAQQ
jgi:broad specificity phosphatase PhoE